MQVLRIRIHESNYRKVATKKVKQEVKKEVEPEKVEEPEEMETDEVDRKNLKMKAVKMVKQENGVDNSLMWVDKYKPTGNFLNVICK